MSHPKEIRCPRGTYVYLPVTLQSSSHGMAGGGRGQDQNAELRCGLVPFPRAISVCHSLGVRRKVKAFCVIPII